VFFEILNGFYLIILRKKVGQPLIRVEKKFLRNKAYRASKEAEFSADFKNVQKFQVWQKEKNFFSDKLIF
jgi:hypothetical protein